MQWAGVVVLGLAGLRAGNAVLLSSRQAGRESSDPGSCLPALSNLPLQAANTERVIINLTLHPSSPFSAPGMTTCT